MGLLQPLQLGRKYSGFTISSLNLATKLLLQSAPSVAKNPEHHGRMKHLDLQFYWLRNEVEKGSIKVVHLCSNEMPANIMTKSLGRVKVGEMVRMIGLV